MVKDSEDVVHVEPLRLFPVATPGNASYSVSSIVI
jgi:hypothetical protein